VLHSLLNHLWQSTLCLGAVALVTLALSRHAARVGYWLWFTASLKFLLPFAPLVALGTHLGVRHAIALPPLLHELAEPFPGSFRLEPLAAFSPLILTQALTSPAAGGPAATAVWLALWGLGTLLVAGRFLARWLRIRATLRQSVPLALAAPVPVRRAATPIEPGVVGIFQPVLLLPEEIEEHLTPEQLDTIVLHELGHVRCADNLTAAVHMLVEALFWFHPAVWWLGRRLLAERERACDEAVIAAGCDRETYAQSILDVCRLYLKSPLACAAGIASAQLQERIEFIMTPRRLRALGAPVMVLLSLLGAVTVLVPIAIGAVADTVYPAPEDASSARVLLELLRQGRYAELDQRMSSYQAAYRQGSTDSMALARAFSAFRVADPSLGPAFDACVESFPASYVARLARGIYYFRSAMVTRGGRDLEHTNTEQLRGMRVYLARSQADLERPRSLSMQGRCCPTPS
jgi:beta-lactamase regulating signal transducer with metallopeptidase domain